MNVETAMLLVFSFVMGLVSQHAETPEKELVAVIAAVIFLSAALICSAIGRRRDA